MNRPRGKLLALSTAALALVVLGVAAWLAWPGWPQLRFWWFFEPLGKNPQGYLEYKHRKTGIVMVALPGGRFLMGAQGRDPRASNFDPRADDDLVAPVHEVDLSPFLIGKMEVTQAQWRAVMRTNPSWFRPGGPYADRLKPGTDIGTLPVEHVSWDECQEFCRRTKLKLPSEAQWEYACRANDCTTWSFGDRLVLYEKSVNAPGERTHPVGTEQPNGFGLYDMHGNVGEWCEDVLVYFSFYSKPEARGPDPVCVEDGGVIARAIRGGDCVSRDSHFADRAVFESSVGFRVAFFPVP